MSEISKDDEREAREWALSILHDPPEGLDSIVRRARTILALLDAAERSITARDEMAKVLEDRARFPDKPDMVGRMIEAHIGNLKLLREQAEARAHAEIDRAATARDAALEEAAKVAENEAKNLPSDEWHQGFRSGCRGAASSIRALKEPT